MTVDELAAVLDNLQREGLGSSEIRDTDGHTIIGVSRPDVEVNSYAVHIEAEF